MPEGTRQIISDILLKTGVIPKSPRQPLQPEQPQSRENLFLETPQEKILRTGEIVEAKELNKGSGEFNKHLIEAGHAPLKPTSPFFIKLRDGGSGIFKPASREWNYRKTMRIGTRYKRERAAYLVDKFLGFGLVPTTVIRKINGEIGSLQEFIPGTSDYKYFLGVGERHIPPEASNMFQNTDSEHKKLWIFDYLIYSNDRNYTNLLIKDNKKLFAIDNGLSFGNERGFQYVEHTAQFYDDPLPLEIRERIVELLLWDKGKGVLRKSLRELLGRNETIAFFERMQKISNFLTEYGDKIPLKASKELTFK